MSFSNYEQYSSSNSSEKISIAFIYPRADISLLSSQGSNVWTTQLDFILNNLFINNQELTQADDENVSELEPWYFDISTSTLYYYTTSSNPSLDDIVGEFKLLYSNHPLILPYDLTDDGFDVSFEPRLTNKADFKSDVGSTQTGISVTGNGVIELKNNDGFFDDFYYDFIWDNKLVEVYSFNRDLPASEATLRFKGFITDKDINLDKVKFKINDILFKTNTQIPSDLFSLSDGVSEAYVGTVKRTIYGKVNGLLCRSVDQVPDSGRLLSGTVSGSAASTTITGTGTSFLTFVAQNDTVLINSIEYSVQQVNSDTEIIISDTDGLSSTFASQEIYVIPSVASPEFNREFFIAGHAIKQSSSTITSMNQLNRLTVDNIDSFETGDLININSDSFTIASISGNIIQLNVNANEIYPNGTIVSKEPITEYFIEDKRASVTNISNISNVAESKFTLDTLAEYNVTSNDLITDPSFNFTNGSRIVNYTGSAELSSFFRERDWISISGSSVEFMRIVDIVGNQIRCKDVFTGITQTGANVLKRRPKYIENDTAVSVNCFGKTKDGTSTGILIETGVDVVRDLLGLINLTSSIDSTSFDNAAIDNNMRLSIKVPKSIESGAPTIKDIINDVNKTIQGSLSIKQDFTLSYNINSAEVPTNITTISDDDVITWRVKGGNNKIFKKVNSNYDFKDYDLTLKDEKNEVLTYESEKVIKYDSSNLETSQNFFTLSEQDTKEASERFIYSYENLYSEINIQSDLRLSNLEVGDVVEINFRRLFKKTNNSSSYFRVTGIEIKYNRVNLTVSNFGGLFNKSARITANDALDYSTALSQDKRYNGYITDEDGTITNEDNTKNKNLIS